MYCSCCVCLERRAVKWTPSVLLMLCLFRTSAVNRENPGSNALAAVSKLSQSCSSNIASVHSTVQMSAWLQTTVDI